MIVTTQLPQRFREVIDDQIATYKKVRTVQHRNEIPDTSEIPLDDKRHWLKIPEVICVFVDMLGSTRLSASTADAKTAGAYQLFSDTAVRLFDKFEAPYIDVRGDGVFALYNSNQPYRAFASAVTFKTFVKEEFVDRVKGDTGIQLGVHVGIDQKTVLVKKLGLRRFSKRTDRQNEVWAGKPVNMAAKLASLTSDGQLLISDRFFKKIPHEKARKTCGCPNGVKVDLWSENDLTADSRFDFNKGYVLSSNWCSTHGARYCDDIVALDK